MTAEQAAQRLGMSAETLVQEVIRRQTAFWVIATVLTALVFLAVCAALVRGGIGYDADTLCLMLLVLLVVVIALTIEVQQVSTWIAAPETAARIYIMEETGGTEWK